METALTKQIWDLHQDDRQTVFLRGQKRTIDVIRKMPEELSKVLEARKGDK